MRSLLGKPQYGLPPARLQHQPELHRVFKLELAQTPRMWATHPSNADREANAKRAYIHAEIDSGSVWGLFDDPQAVKERMSRHVFSKTDAAPAPLEESLKRLDEQYACAFFRPEYRGVYLGRSVVQYAKDPANLYAKPAGDVDTVAALDALYP